MKGSFVVSLSMHTFDGVEKLKYLLIAACQSVRAHCFKLGEGERVSAK